jgi:hypothetical protein
MGGFSGYYRLGPWDLDSEAGGDGPQLIVDPYAGVRYTYLDLDLDISGGPSLGNDQDDFAWQAIGLVSYRFGLFGENNSRFLFGYRALHQDYSNGRGANKFEWDVTLHGPIFALAVEF